MKNPLLNYLNKLSPAEREVFAREAESSVNSLRLAANGYKTNGKLAITAEFAARIERASGGVLRRQDLADVCRKCPFARECDRHSDDQY